MDDAPPRQQSSPTLQSSEAKISQIREQPFWDFDVIWSQSLRSSDRAVEPDQSRAEHGRRLSARETHRQSVWIYCPISDRAKLTS